MTTLVVAIDGPSGAGKSTVARRVAEILGLEVLDTGAMYRAVALAVLEDGADPDDARRCAAIASTARIEVGDRVTLDGRDVTDAIRGPQVTAHVSRVAAHPPVREVLVAHQRAWGAAHGGGVVEGRDIGTVVFPDATVKVFLTASESERTRRRRVDEAGARREVSHEEVRAALEARDTLDSSRAASPLRPAPDALVIDTTTHAIDDTVAQIVAQARGRKRSTS